MVRPTYKHVIVRTGFTLPESPWYFGDFRNIFLPNIRKDQINVLPSERGAPGTTPYGKFDFGLCTMFIKKAR